jgi:hypothetical protein
MDMDFVTPRLQTGGYLDGVPLRSPGPDEAFYQNGDLQLFPSLKSGTVFSVGQLLRNALVQDVFGGDAAQRGGLGVLLSDADL